MIKVKFEYNDLSKIKFSKNSSNKKLKNIPYIGIKILINTNLNESRKRKYI